MQDSPIAAGCRRPRAALWLACCSLFAIATALPARADGLDDLRSALAKLQGTAPIRATITAQVTASTRDDDDKVRVETGTASLTVEDGPLGLKINYPREIMVKAMAEGASRQTDSTAPVPTRNALNELDYSDVHGMVHAAETLLARIEGAKLKAERSEVWSGVPARVLSLDLAVAKNQQFVSKQVSTLDVWIDATGRPLASRAQSVASGRAFVVISFEVKNREDRVYSVVGDRLLVTRRESSGSGSGVGQRGDTKALVTLLAGG